MRTFNDEINAHVLNNPLVIAEINLIVILIFEYILVTAGYAVLSLMSLVS